MKTKWKITPEVLEKAGYKRHTPHAHNPYCTHFFQKTVYSGDIKLYFLNIEIWHFHGPMFPEETQSVSAKVWLYRKNDAAVVEYLCLPTTALARIERFYHEAFQNLECVPDKHNN